MKHLKFLNRTPTVLMLFAFIALSLSRVSSVSAQSFANWKVSYYNNTFLSDPPVLDRTETEINFDWGGGSPANQVRNNNFSARYGADVYFAAGTYRFTLQADDIARLWLDGRVVISSLDNPQPGAILTADVTLSAGSHHLQVDYIERTGNAHLKLNWVNAANIPVTPTPTGNWHAQYYSNTTLSGSPTLVANEVNPSHNWGLNAPYAGLPADNFSARWSTTVALSAGQYQIRAAADDGTRVYVNGIAYINEWHLATGATYTTTVTLPAGSHNIVVEYFEAGYAAFLDFSFTPLNPTTPAPTTATATVTTGTLNVRSAPSTITGAVLTKVRQGQTFSVTGRNAETTWWQINVGGIVGWVSGAYVHVINGGGVPVVGGTTPTIPQPTGLTVNTVANLNVRTGPSTGFSIVAKIPSGGGAQVIGRNAANTWLQVVYSGVTGWVSAAWVVSGAPINFSQIPITG